jgi:hypothetical protein
VRAERVPVRVIANEPDIALMVRTGQAETLGTGTGFNPKGGTYSYSYIATSAAYANVCTAPCEAVIAEGTYRMALSRAGGTAIAIDDPVIVRGPSTLEGHYEWNRAARVTGWVTFGLSLAAATVLIATVDRSQSSPYGSGQALAGFGIGIAGVAIGIPLAARSDEAWLSVVSASSPESSTPASPPSERHGFFQRVSAGPVWLRSKDVVGASATGVAPMGEYAVGGTLAPGLVLGGTVQGGRTDVSDGSTNHSVALDFVGPFVDYHFAVDRGAYLTGAGGMGLNARGELSFAASIGGGFDFAVIDRMKLGPIARVLYSVEQYESIVAPSLGIAATYY